MTAKIHFRLEPDQDGFPPISVEMLNATPLGDGLFRIENAPFFVREISFNDVVRASSTKQQGQYRYEEVVQPSEFTSLSIIILDSSMNTLLLDLLRGLKCVIEYGEFGVYRVLAVAVPSTVDYESLRRRLQALEDNKLLSFSELAVSNRNSRAR